MRQQHMDFWVNDWQESNSNYYIKNKAQQNGVDIFESIFSSLKESRGKNI